MAEEKEAETKGFNVSEIYQGGYSSLKPSYGSLGEGKPLSAAGTIGLTTDGRSANQLKEFSSKVQIGLKHIEIPMVSPEVFDSMPKDQLKEINRLSKLTGVSVSVHAPVIDVAGFSQQGFSELNREASERKLANFVERLHELDPDGNIPLTFHAAEGIAGSQFKIVNGKKVPERLIVVNRENGKMVPIEVEKKYYPHMRELKEEAESKPPEKITKKDFIEYPLEKGITSSHEEELRLLNHTEWDNSVAQIAFNKEHADRILETTYDAIREKIPLIKTNQLKPEHLTETEKKIWSRIQSADEYLKQASMSANALFNRAYKYGDENTRKILKKTAEEYKKLVEIANIDPYSKSQAMQILIDGLEKAQPEMYIPIEEFAVEQSSKTFANAALHGYKKFRGKAPIISIENPPIGFALSTGEDVKALVEKSRKVFVEQAVKPKNEGGLGLSKSQAEKQAEKIIGATLDVGHMNMLRKYKGVEGKHVVEESAKMAPYLKHVHLSDNFGFEHTELPMGMGNVPMKKIMEKLGKKGFEAKKVVEAISWWQHFSPQGAPPNSPFKPTLEAMGSPIYSMEMAPYWNQSLGLSQSYPEGFGLMLPQGHFETFGAGFSGLPPELGGQRQQAPGSRVSGRPME